MGLFDGVEDVLIGATAADVTAHLFADVLIGVGVTFFYETDGRAYLAGRAVTALKGIVFQKGGLHGVEVVALCEPFDGGYLGVLAESQEVEAGIDPPAVEQDGAGAALAMVAAFFCAGEM